jgi:hypothetical protein
MPDITWTTGDVINLLEKSVQLVTTLVRVFKTPDRTLQRITDLTQRLRAGEVAIDQELDELYKEQD